ncbi:MAG: cyanophycinase [Bacteroidota bacterium]
MSENSKKGYLVLVGGAEDKKEDKIVLKRIIGLNNAKNIAVIPTASEYPGTLGDAYYHAFRELGVETINILDIRTKEEANQKEFIEKLNQADLLFFTGGDQCKLVKAFIGTAFYARLLERHETEGLTIAGTSAGAAGASNPMIFDGDYQGLTKGAIHYSEGFGLIKDITIDTHFVARGRIGRLTSFLCSGYSKRGIGLGEDTGIIIAPDNVFEVIGSGMVTTVSTDNLSFTNYDEIENNDKIVLMGVQAGFLQPGTVFDINKWDVLKSGVQNYYTAPKETISTSKESFSTSASEFVI